MGFKGLVLASVMVLTVSVGCEDATEACSDRQEVCTSYCDLSVECMDYFDPECVTDCLETMQYRPISWMKVCVDNAQALLDKATTREEMDLACPIAFSESGLEDCLDVERARSSWSCSNSHIATICAEDGCCVVNDCVDVCGIEAVSAVCESLENGQVSCVCAIP
jgi:hypothetical protein